MVPELINKYIWLIQTFIKAGIKGMDLQELATKWENRWGSNYPRSSFNNHRLAIENIFGIIINCNRSTNKYYITYSDDITDQNNTTEWLINTFTINNLLTLSKERLTGRVSVENIPSGQKHLTSIIDSMLYGYQITIQYGKYYSNDIQTYNIKPYGLKEYAKRWYVLGYCIEKQSLRIYGLDRIQQLTISDIKYTIPKNFNIDYYFKDCIGIYKDENIKVQNIYFATSTLLAKYLQDLPLHNSQVEITNYKNIPELQNITLPSGLTKVFKIKIRPEKTLYREIFRDLDEIVVLHPQEVKNELKQLSENIYHYYKDL